MDSTREREALYRLRLKTPDTLSPSQLKRLKDEGLKFKGKPYDQYFGWSDEKIYCSELVWKMYKSALGMELGKLSDLAPNVVPFIRRPLAV